jgi:type I restriction enzyme S subunit
LGEVCELKSGTTISPSLERVEGDVLYTKVADMNLPENLVEIITSSRFVNSTEIKKNQIIPEGAIIFPKRGGAIATNKKRKIVRPTIVDLNTMAIIPGKRINKDYFFHWFQLFDLNDISNGANIPQINNYSFDEVYIPYPVSLPEQQRIVSILDEAFAAIDKAKANAEQNLKNAKELFESYLQGVFENWKWEWKTLDQISDNLDSKRIPITKSKRTSGSIPYYGASGVVDHVEDFIFDEDLLCISEDGANLLARTYPIAFSISGKTWVNNHAHILRFKSLTTQKFIEHYINSIRIDDYVSGMAQPKLNQKNLNKIPVPSPPVEAEDGILRSITLLRAETQKMEAIYQKKIADLEELKKSVLQKAFAGELKVSELGWVGLKDDKIKMNT